MPVKVVKKQGKFRLVEPNGRVAKTKNGRARDGGGHRSRAKAVRQARAMNGRA